MNGFLLDTNVVSELVKPKPDANVVAWFRSTQERLLYLSVLTIGEIRRGIMLAQPERRAKLERWCETQLLLRFRGRILSVDLAVSEVWGRNSAELRRSGLAAPAIDGLLAATAAANSLAIVTRNVRHFEQMGARIIDPWTRSSPETEPEAPSV